METKTLQERLLTAWIGTNVLIKNSRITQGLTYNEAITMKLAMDQYRADQVGQISVQHIRKQTGMLKSQVNRTVNSLCEQGYLTKVKSETDRRSLFVRLVPARLPDFLEIHAQSLRLARRIIAVIGEERAESFIGLYETLAASGLQLSSEHDEENKELPE